MKEDNGSTDIDLMFETAIANRNNGAFPEAIKGLLRIISTYPNDVKIYGVHAVLGGIYADLKDFTNSLASFKNAAELNPKSELASLGMYLCYVELDRDEEAIQELIKYLTYYPANLYKDTLVELLGRPQEWIHDKLRTGNFSACTEKQCKYRRLEDCNNPSLIQMSRSVKKTPKKGVTGAKSEKDDKREANRKLRRTNKVKLKAGNAEPKSIKEVSNVWGFEKDGKQFLAKPSPKDLRK